MPEIAYREVRLNAGFTSMLIENTGKAFFADAVNAGQMTLDNGKEFAQHAQMANILGEGVFFARPSHPWERGTNENTNGLIRQFVPKRTDFAKISHPRIKEIENLLNERPRKRHGYRTPNEVFKDAQLKTCCN